jgi:sortase A
MPVLAHAERLLWVGGALSLAYCLVVGVQVRGAQSIADGVGKLQQTGDRVTQNDASLEGVIGRIEIPALALSAPITSDYDVNSLRLGVGHIPGTAVPGGLGTVGLAGHRDSFFRPLRKVTAKMEILLVDKNGTYHYVVDSTEIVSPDKVEVLDIVARPELTLITCFPFDYVGAAPKRFIVHAHLLSASPDGVSVIH